MLYYVVDAFTDKLFRGNPAGVCLPEKWPDEALMQSIAAENNLAETAFVVRNGDHYDLRWFTPEMEIDLCGHATLATAFVLANYTGDDSRVMRFHTQSGVLTVCKKGDLYEMDFPSRKPKRTQVLPLMERALGVPVLEAYQSRDLLVLLRGQEDVLRIEPDYKLMCEIPGCFAMIATAEGKEADFVSRFFAPGAGVPEDPVTGSAHATLIPFWAERLNKRKLLARQLSGRGGTLYCEDCGERVKIAGYAVLYLQGEIKVGENG